MQRSTERSHELTVILKAKELASYILTITDKSPKRFRFTLSSRLQNYALDIIENLYLANETFARTNGPAAERRLALQHKAMTQIKLLDYTAHLAVEEKCILFRQYEQISRQVSDCQNLLGAWINSDRRRYSGK